MQTAEGAAIVIEYLRAEMCLLEYQLNRLEDVALSVENPDLEGDLRMIAAEIRKSIDAMRVKLEPVEDYELTT